MVSCRGPASVVESHSPFEITLHNAGVVCVPFVAALVTPFEVSAERGSPAQFDSAQHTLLPHR
jgi:hypothetical protein